MQDFISWSTLERLKIMLYLYIEMNLLLFSHLPRLEDLPKNSSIWIMEKCTYEQGSTVYSSVITQCSTTATINQSLSAW